MRAAIVYASLLVGCPAPPAAPDPYAVETRRMVEDLARRWAEDQALRLRWDDPIHVVPGDEWLTLGDGSGSGICAIGTLSTSPLVHHGDEVWVTGPEARTFRLGPNGEWQDVEPR